MGKLNESYQFIKMRDNEKTVVNAISFTHFVKYDRATKHNGIMDTYYIDICLVSRNSVNLKYEAETARDMDYSRLMRLLNVDTGE